MKSVGTGLRRVNDKSQQREECQVLGIGKYRQNKNKMEYEVFWDGHPSTFQQMQYLQGCLQHIKYIFTERKTKLIYKRRRPGFLAHLKRFDFQPEHIPFEQSSNYQIQLQSDEEKSQIKFSILSQSSLLQEGELKIQSPKFKCRYADLVNESPDDLLKHQNIEKSKRFKQSKVFLQSFPQQESQLTVNRNSTHYNPTMCFGKTSQNNSEVGEFLSVLSSEKSQNINQISIQKEKQLKSQSFGIYKQLQISEISIKPKVESKPKQSIKDLKKQKVKLKLKSGILNINIPPLKKEEVFVTKSIRDGRKVMFEIMVYNQNGILVPKKISHQQLVIKAPYALLKYYESRIIY